MTKVKVVVLVILGVVLVAFAVENAQPSPVIKLFKLPLGELPTYLLVYLSLAVGIIIGWVAHAVRRRRKKREAQGAASTQQQQQESQ
jgi:uncharacterized integral membrane protein